MLLGVGISFLPSGCDYLVLNVDGLGKAMRMHWLETTGEPISGGHSVIGKSYCNHATALLKI
jgi:hypothetical protein